MEDYTERKSRIAREKEKEETARKMIAKGMDHAEIAELVGLSVAQVEQLAKETK
jgi:predicted transposase/invertase (TIGR01784 family)